MSRRWLIRTLGIAVLASLATCQHETEVASAPPDPAPWSVAVARKSTTTPPRISDAGEDVQRWVAEHAIPLRTVEAGNGFDDIWLKVPTARQHVSYSSGIASHAIVSPRWIREELEIMVPDDARSLSYGLALVGEGEASIDGVELDVLDR